MGGTFGATSTYTFTVSGPGGFTATKTGTTPQCFTIPAPTSGTYTLTVTDSNGCTRTASTTVTVNNLTTPTLTKVSGPSCDGTTVFQVALCPPQAGASYSFSTCSGAALSGTYDPATCRYTVKLPQGQTTCVMVTVSNGNAACNKTAQVSVPVPLKLAVGAPTVANAPCNGIVTFQASASGGSGAYSYRYKLNGGTAVAGVGASGNQFIAMPTLVNGGINTACQTLEVTVTDGAGCSARASVTFSQCVSTTLGCAP